MKIHFGLCTFVLCIPVLCWCCLLFSQLCCFAKGDMRLWSNRSVMLNFRLCRHLINDVFDIESPHPFNEIKVSNQNPFTFIWPGLRRWQRCLWNTSFCTRKQVHGYTVHSHESCQSFMHTLDSITIQTCLMIGLLKVLLGWNFSFVQVCTASSEKLHNYILA